VTCHTYTDAAWHRLAMACSDGSRPLRYELAAHAHQGHTHTQAMFRETQADTRALLDRMDQRADARHRDVIQPIQALQG
jgi:hypothetical protein